MPRKSSRNIQNQLSVDYCETNQCFVRQVGKHSRLQPGDTLWTKVIGCSWWPAQVVNEKSISTKHKRKAAGEVLVRLYGTYEYLYVDPVKSHSEFVNKLEQENSNSKEVFQKALEEVLSHPKSGCNSKRKVTSSFSDSKIKRQKTSGNSMGKRREQHVVEGSHENQNLASPEAQADNVKKLKPVRRQRGKSKAEAFRDKKSRKYDLRKTKDREQKNVSIEKDQKNTKHIVCVKSGENATATKENATSKVSRGKKPEKISTDNDDADGLAIVKTHSHEAAKESSAIPKKRGKALQENKMMTNEVKKRKACEAFKDNNIIEANVPKKPNLGRRLRDRTSDVKTATQDVVNPTVKEKSDAKASNCKLTKKAKNVVVDVKRSKQNVSTPAKGTSRTKSPVSKKVAEAEEESMSIKMKVMQSLGLIAPSGSPFKRNRITKGGRRIF